MGLDSVFITGVSSGIGWGLANQYLSSGARVYGISRRTPESLAHPNMSFLALDLAELDTIAGGLRRLLVGVERLDLVILNAGILGEIADMSEHSLDQLRRMMDVNVWSNKLILDALHEMSVKPRQVVTISSGAAVNGNRGWGGYSISKAALNMLTKLYAAENPGIHFTALAPGLVDTAMQDYLCDHSPDERFPSLEVLKSRRHTPDMPDRDTAAANLTRLIPQLTQHTESGAFVDVRSLPAGIR